MGGHQDEEVVEYLARRFDSRVELAALRVQLPAASLLRLLLTRGRGELARVEGEGLSLRHKGRRDVPPMLAVNRLRFDVDLGTLFDTALVVPSAWIEGLAINIPPKGERPSVAAGSPEAGASGPSTRLVVREVIVRDARLVILPRDPARIPLEFGIRDLRLHPQGTGIAMRYQAAITNPKPPGAIQSVGSFGPWNADEPGATPLSGSYTFKDADLGVFAAIAGFLESTGSFEGTLEAKIDVPPLAGATREKLKLDGRFEVRRGKFLRAAAQDKVDSLSRRGQGRPDSEEIDDVVSGMKGSFTLENQVIRFRSLSFGVSGADVDLKGSYDLRGDALDFHGTLKLQARVSETMTGWKRWVLKPVEPFFAKDGAGTFLRIRVTGSSAAPKFAGSRR